VQHSIQDAWQSYVSSFFSPSRDLYTSSNVICAVCLCYFMFLALQCLMTWLLWGAVLYNSSVVNIAANCERTPRPLQQTARHRADVVSAGKRVVRKSAVAVDRMWGTPRVWTVPRTVGQNQPSCRRTSWVWFTSVLITQQARLQWILLLAFIITLISPD